MKEFSGLLSWMVVKGSQEQDSRENNTALFTSV